MEKVKKYTGEVDITFINPKRTGMIILSDYTDETGKPRALKDAFGNSRVIKYTAHKTLNLNDENDILEYEHLKDHPIYVKGGSPLIALVNKQEIAENSIDKKELTLDALIIAKELRGEKLGDFARILGINTTNVLESIIKSQMYNLAEENPRQFLENWNDPNRTFKQLAFKGKTNGVFTIERTGAWKYRDVTMGMNIDEVLQWFKANDDLIPSIKKEINSLK